VFSKSSLPDTVYKGGLLEVNRILLTEVEKWSHNFIKRLCDFSKETISAYESQIENSTVVIMLEDYYPNSEEAGISREIYGRMGIIEPVEIIKFKVWKYPNGPVGLRFRSVLKNGEIWEFGYTSNNLGSGKPLFRFVKRYGCGKLEVESPSLAEIAKLEQIQPFREEMQEILRKLEYIDKVPKCSERIY
jgi:hypothetical protein